MVAAGDAYRLAGRSFCSCGRLLLQLVAAAGPEMALPAAEEPFLAAQRQSSESRRCLQLHYP
jgi:hypothetical protein